MDNKNREAQFLNIPTMKHERQYGFMDATFVNCGWAIATWCFLTGGLTANLVDFKTAIIAAFAGNLIGVAIMLFAEITTTVKYGVDTYPTLVSFLGRNGMKILLVFFIVINIGWVAVLSAMFSNAVQNTFTAVTGQETGSVFYTAVAIIAVLITWFMVFKGLKTIQWLNRVVVPCLAFTMIVMIWAIFNKYGINTVFSAEPLAPYDNETVNIVLAIELNVGAGLSWWASLGSLTRTTTTARGAMWANWIGVGTLEVIAVLLGTAAAYVIGGSDPTTWMIPLGGVALGIIALVFVCIGNISSNAIVMYATCLGMKQYKLFANMSWLKVTTIYVAPVIILEFIPEVLYGNYQILLNGSAAFFSSLAAVQIVDFYLLRKEHFDLRSVYNTTSESGYYFWKGVNWGGLACVILGGITYCLLLNPLTWEYSSMLTVFKSASIPAFAVAFILYFIYAKLVLVPSKKGALDEYKNYYRAIQKKGY